MIVSRLLDYLVNTKNSQTYDKLVISQLEEKIEKLKKIGGSNQSESKMLSDSLGLRDNKELYNQQDLISYIIHINFSESNTLLNVTDIEGLPKIMLSSGSVGLKGKQKRFQPTAVVKLLKVMFSRVKFIGEKPVAIHFTNARRYHILLAIKLLKKKVFIRTIRNYNLKAYNGCRPRKMRRMKQRKK